MNNADEWRLSPLSAEDLFAGLSLILIAAFSISVYAIMMKIMKRQDKEIVGYRFLISAGCSDILLLINYGLWPGLTILLKSEIIPKGWRTWQQVGALSDVFTSVCFLSDLPRLGVVLHGHTLFGCQLVSVDGYPEAVGLSESETEDVVFAVCIVLPGGTDSGESSSVNNSLIADSGGARTCTHSFSTRSFYFWTNSRIQNSRRLVTSEFLIISRI